MRLIVTSRASLGVPALETRDLLIAVRSWCDVLDGEVPERDLEDAFRRALRDKDSSYSFGSSEVVKGYRANCESERAAPRQAQDRNLLAGDVCGKCFGSGWEPTIVDGYKTRRLCDHLIPERRDDEPLIESDLTAAGF